MNKRLFLLFLIVMMLIGYAWAGDIKHPSLPRGNHNGEPCLFGQLGCGAATPVATPSGQPTPSDRLSNPQNLTIATDPMYGAVGDAIFSGDGSHQADGVTNHTTTFFSQSGNFQPSMKGDLVFIVGGGALGGLYQGTVVSVQNNTTLTLNTVPLTNIAGTAHYIIGKDNTAALQMWVNGMRNSTLPNQPKGYLPFGVYLHRGLDFTQSNNLQIEGAGSAITAGGSILLCISPTVSVCHDFSGSTNAKIQDMGMWSGSGTAQESGNTNLLAAGLPGLPVENDKFVDVAFRSNGNYNVGTYDVQGLSFIDDIFNLGADNARPLIFSAANSQLWTSPIGGSLATAPQKSSGITILGAKTEITANATTAVTLDEAQNPQFLDNIEIDGATVALNNGATGVADTCQAGCTIANSALEHIALTNLNWQAGDTASRLVNLQGAAVNWQLTGFASYSGQPANPDMAFVSGFYSSLARVELPLPNGSPAFSASSCLGSILQVGQGGTTAVNTPCSTSAGTVSSSAGVITQGGPGGANSVINVTAAAYGAKGDGVTDDTAAIQNAVNTACPGKVCNRAVYVPAGQYKVTQLNFTGLSGLKINGDSAAGWPARVSSINCTETSNNTGICIDLSGGTSYIEMDNLTISANIGAAPKVLMLLAKKTGALNQAAGFVYSFNDDTFLQQGGDWGVYEYGGEQAYYKNCYWNGTPNIAGWMISVANTPGITSPFATLPTAPTSMVRVRSTGGNYSVLSGSGVPIMFDTGAYQIMDGQLDGYCNTPNGEPCITEYSAADTGGIINYKFDEIRDEPQGTNPGALLAFIHTTLWYDKVFGTWNPQQATSNPAFTTAGLLQWTSLQIWVPPSFETSNTIVCTGTNVLNSTILAGTPGGTGNQLNNCPGAAVVGNNYGRSHGTAISSVDVNGVVNAQSLGALPDLIYSGDGIHATDGACTGTAFTSASGGFTSGASRVGQAVIIDSAGTAGATYVGTVQTVNSATSMTVTPSCPTSVSSKTWRVGTDNSSAFQAAINAVQNSAVGTVYIPAGNYLTLSQVTVGPTKCNVTIDGDPSGTVLMSWINGSSTASTANAFAFVDTVAENPQQCYGGMRNITFQDVGGAPNYLNLIKVEDEQGLTFDNIRANHYAGVDDSFFYLDPGAGGNLNTCGGGAACSRTEQTLIRNVNNWFTTSMVTFAGDGYPNFSLNNNTVTESQCNPTASGGGACIRLYNWGGSGALLNSHLDFNADLNASSEDLIQTDHRADDWNGAWTVDIRSQSLTTGTALFNAPASTGSWLVNGSVIGTGGSVVQERNSNGVVFQPNSQGVSVETNSPVTVSACGSSPSLSAGSGVNAGEVVAGTGATSCTINFGFTTGVHNVACTAADDGQPLLWYPGTKSNNAVTFTCYNPNGGANCTAGAFLNWHCYGF